MCEAQFPSDLSDYSFVLPERVRVEENHGKRADPLVVNHL